MRVAGLLRVIGIALALVGVSDGARAQVYRGNDTGGIIPWSCEAEAYAPQIAAEYCARWDKYPRITSVHREYGDYISFRCLWSPYVDRYALPAVGTSKACLREQFWTK